MIDTGATHVEGGVSRLQSWPMLKTGKQNFWPVDEGFGIRPPSFQHFRIKSSAWRRQRRPFVEAGGAAEMWEGGVDFT